jgi:hypothetical protein
MEIMVMAKVEKKCAMTAKELLFETYESLQAKLEGATIELGGNPAAVIGYSSDPHRTDIEYTIYEDVFCAKINGKNWIVALGKATQGYLSRQYDYDIAAVSINPQNPLKWVEAFKGLERNRDFKDSLILAMSNGTLALPVKGRFVEEVAKVLLAMLAKFTVIPNC